MTKAKAAALAESNEEAVELRSRRFCGWQRNTQRLFFVGPSGERFRKKPEGLKRAAGQTASFRSTENVNESKKSLFRMGSLAVNNKKSLGVRRQVRRRPLISSKKGEAYGRNKRNP